jgi:hypothetical protein
MIVYTVRGGSGRGDLDGRGADVRVPRRRWLVFVALLNRIPAAGPRSSRRAPRRGSSCPGSHDEADGRVHALGRRGGGVALTLATHGTDQFLVQRLLSARSERDAKLGLVLSGFIVFCAVHAVPRHRHHDVRVVPAHPRRRRSRAPTRFCRRFVVGTLTAAWPGSSWRRSSPRRSRRR